MYYDKQIRYIDYLENGEKKYNCGYVKITVSGGRLILEMQIRGLYETDDVAAEVILEGAGTENRIGSVIILQGSGSFRWEIRDPVKEGEEMSVREGLQYGQLERIRVQISPRRSLQCVWRKPVLTEEVQLKAREDLLPRRENVEEMLPEREPEELTPRRESMEELPPQRENMEELPHQQESMEEMPPEQEPEELPHQQESVEEEQQPVFPERRVPEPEEFAEDLEPAAELQEPHGAQISIEEHAKPAEMAEASWELPGAAVSEPPETANTEIQQEPSGRQEQQTREAQRRSLHGPRAAAMSEDKWRQLWKIYPHIRPFRDEREYLSLWPEDFVVLRSDDYRLAHNSFLLHGYYNYEHLILTQMSVRGADRYYIGVPGNFYEKEKQVAIMFGFESFECRQEPAQEGDFGYYMIRVEL